MLRLGGWIILVVLLLAPGAVHAAECSALAGLSADRLPHASISAAAPVAAGPFSPDGDPAHAAPTPAFCRVVGVIGQSVRFEIWLPDNWNGKFLMAAAGGGAGYINYADMRKALAAGYATAATDTGHVAGDNAWMGNPDLLDRWVVGGAPPSRIEASHVGADGRATRTRPLCAWPGAARWDGVGDTDKAASFSCAAPPRS